MPPDLCAGTILGDQRLREFVSSNPGEFAHARAQREEKIWNWRRFRQLERFKSVFLPELNGAALRHHAVHSDLSELQPFDCRGELVLFRR